MSFLLETRNFDSGNLPFEETLYHNANGYIGVRANFEENEATSGMRGTYINAFHDTHPIHHPEKLFGFPETGEKIANVTDVQTIRAKIGNQILSLNTENVANYRRYLDMQRGVTGRHFIWTADSGDRIQINTRRLASFTHPEVFYIQYRLTALNPLHLSIESLVQGKVKNYNNPADPRVSGVAFQALEALETKVSENRIRMESRTKSTGLYLRVQVDHSLYCSDGSLCEPDSSSSVSDARLEWCLSLDTNETLILEKRAIYCDSLRYPKGWDSVNRIAEELSGKQFSDLAEEQERYLTEFWNEAGITIEGDPHILKGLRYNIYNLLQSAPRDTSSSIPAKGLSGEGYEGHYFWDTEIYMLPFFLYTRPETARVLLEYRYTILPGARRHARNMGHKKGAAYPWRTIAGRECSAYYPSGSAQYHINADIAYAIRCYWEATQDREFILLYGAEILFETARIWLEIGNYSDKVFHINAVTGPDEYTCMVNDNYYTNRMAGNNLETAFEIYSFMKSSYPERLAEIADRIQLSEEEPNSWIHAASAMFLPYDATRDINPQDSEFLQKPIWDFNATPHDKYPLLLHYHHLTLSRYQVCKQADTLLAYVLLDHGPPSSTVRNSYKYYQSITTHDSSLSRAAFAVLAAQLGAPETAYRYFSEIAAVDLDDSHGNTRDGIHAANMGGTWMATVWGFGGFRPNGTTASFSPLLPDKWTSLEYKVRYRGSSIRVRVKPEEVSLELDSGPPIEVEVYGKRQLLESKLAVPARIGKEESK